MRFLTLVLFVVGFLAVGWGWFFGPYYLDAFKMEDVAGTAVLSWAAYDEPRGRIELADQLRRREIPDYLTPEACRFYQDPGNIRVVDCAWTVDVYLPVVDQTRRLSFQVRKSAGVDGRLLQ